MSVYLLCWHFALKLKQLLPAHGLVENGNQQRTINNLLKGDYFTLFQDTN